MSEPLVTLTQVRRRGGWTDGMVEKFLGPHVATKPGPFGCIQRCWRRADVEAAEQTEGWRGARDRNERSQRTRHEATLAIARTFRMAVELVPADELRKLAIEAYNCHQIDLACRGLDVGRGATEDSEPEFLERITVNYVRHNLTRYDEGLQWLQARAGRLEAEAIIKRRVYDEIARAYPELAAECRRQAEKRGAT